MRGKRLQVLQSELRRLQQQHAVMSEQGGGVQTDALLHVCRHSVNSIQSWHNYNF